jgi:hypothetical protein
MGLLRVVRSLGLLVELYVQVRALGFFRLFVQLFPDDFKELFRVFRECRRILRPAAVFQFIKSLREVFSNLEKYVVW